MVVCWEAKLFELDIRRRGVAAKTCTEGTSIGWHVPILVYYTKGRYYALIHHHLSSFSFDIMQIPVLSPAIPMSLGDLRCI